MTDRDTGDNQLLAAFYHASVHVTILGAQARSTLTMSSASADLAIPAKCRSLISCLARKLMARG